MEVLTPEQLDHLLETVSGDRWEAVYYLAALCALRVGEILSLRYEDIDLAAGTISIRRTVWKYKTYSPKTESSAATLRVPARAIEALRRHSERHGNPSEGWLFETKHGNPVAPETIHKWGWKKALRRAGLPESFTFHSLRHGAASMLIHQGVPIPVVSKYLRHSNPGITMNTYAHYLDSTGTVAVDALDRALGSGTE